MTALGGCRREFHAGGSAADDEEFHRLRCRADRRLALAPGLRVGAAAEAESLERVAVDAVVEGDARTHPLRFACQVEGEPCGVCDQCANEADHVGLTVGDDALGGLGVDDPADVQHRKGRRLLCLPAHLRPVALRVHAVLDVAHRPPVAPDIEIEEIDGAVGLEGLHEAHALIDLVAAIHVLVHCQPQAQRDGPADPLANTADDPAQEAQPVVV